MPFYFCWGETFLAIYAEFWPWQIAEIRMRAEDLFERRPQDDDLECAAQIRASVIPFEMYGYGLVLVLRQDVWMLEVMEFPPHAQPRERVRKARRQRERDERKSARGAGFSFKSPERKLAATKQVAQENPTKETPKKRRADKNDATKRVVIAASAWVRGAFLILYNSPAVAYRNFRQFGQEIASLLQDMKEAIPLSTTVGEQILRLIAPSQQQCREANIAAWLKDRLPPGYQRERRLFLAECLPIWLDTIGPKTIFVRGGKSIFGELFLEGECVL